MKTVSLSGSRRVCVGKKDAKKQRREGKVPCVLYGGKEQVHFTLNELDFNRLVFTPDVYLVNITIDGKEYQSILQDVQYHPVTDKTLHADFLEILPENPITIRIPVNFVGNVPGVMAGGRLIKKLRKLLVKGLAKDMPDYLEIDMSNLNIGDNITVSDIKADKLAFLDMASGVVVGVKTARGVEEDDLDEEDEEGEEEGGETTEEKPAEE